MKIYTNKFKCVFCGRVIGEYSNKNKQRAIRNWASACIECLKKLIKKSVTKKRK